jgi:hypothetical protein
VTVRTVAHAQSPAAGPQRAGAFYFIARLRGRMENRLWRSLGRGTTAEQRARLEGLLTVPEGSRASGLERLRLSPITVSEPALVRALERLQDVRGLEIVSLARFAGAAKVTSIIRLRFSTQFGDVGRLRPLPGSHDPR